MYVVYASSLIKIFQRMYDEHWKYEMGKAEKGCVDCSGAFVYAFNQFGVKYPHGSNAIARQRTVKGMKPISKAKPGMAAFKLREPSEKGYALPDKYRPGGASYNGDVDDYYHIGLVDETGKYVLNAKGTNYGFCRDSLTAKNGWDCVAYLEDVEYEKGGGDMEDSRPVLTAKVVLPAGASGNTVNLRSEPKKGPNIIARIPVGSTVKVLCDMGEWCEVQYPLTENGYMMSNYLEYEGQSGESGDEAITISAEDAGIIDKALKEIENNLEVIRQYAEVIGSVVGRG